MKSVGMVFMSTADSPGTPETKRRPLTSTRVREVPRLRRSTVATPTLAVWKFELVRLMDGVPRVGFFNSNSCKLVAPDAAMSAEVRICSGDGDTAFGDARREPVTCTLVTLSSALALSSVDCANAVCMESTILPAHTSLIERERTVSFNIFESLVL